MTVTGSSTNGVKTVLHPVSDLGAAKAVYAALLGVPPRHDSDDYVGFHEAGQHIRLCRARAAGVTSQVAFWHVSDIEAKLAEVTAAGRPSRSPCATSASAAWVPPSPTRMATYSGCFRTARA